MKKIISLVQSKYEQFLIWILTRATEILIPRYEAKLKKSKKQVSVIDYSKIIPQVQNTWAAEELRKRKEKYDALKKKEGGKFKIKFLGENGSTKVKMNFPCEQLWRAVFGEQDKFSYHDFLLKKEILFVETEKLFKNYKRQNEVDEAYRDLTFKDRFAKKVSSSIFLTEEEKENAVSLSNLEARINHEIESIKSERSDFLEKNTKTERIKVCDCLENCFCTQAQRVVLSEDGQEIVLFDNLKEMSEHYKVSLNYEDLGLEIEEYSSEKKDAFTVNKDEFILFLSKFGNIRAASHFDHEFKYELPVYQFTFQQLKKAKDEIEKKYGKYEVRYSRLIVNFQTGESNLIYILSKDSEENIKHLVINNSSSKEDLETFQLVIDNVNKDPDFKIISNCPTKEKSILDKYTWVEELMPDQIPSYEIDSKYDFYFLNQNLDVQSPTEENYNDGRLIISLYPFSDQELEIGLKNIFSQLSETDKRYGTFDISNSSEFDIRNDGTLIRKGNLSNILIRRNK